MRGLRVGSLQGWGTLTNYIHPWGAGDEGGRRSSDFPLLSGWDTYCGSLYPVYHQNLCLLAEGHGVCACVCVCACLRLCVRANASVPDCWERIRSPVCKTLLDPTMTFEAKSLAHICLSWVMIQSVTPLEC